MTKIEPRKYSGAEMLFPQAYDAYNAENYELSEMICQRLLEKEPDSVQGNHLMYLLHFKNKKYLQAIVSIAKAIKKEPERASLHLSLARALLEINEYKKSLMACDKTISLRYNMIGAYITKAEVYKKQNNIEKAKEVYEKALRIAPNNELLHNALGNALIAFGDFQSAMKSFQTALKINPNSVQAHTHIASLSQNAVETKDIGLMESLLKSEDVNKNGKIVLNYGLGKEYEKLGDYDRAFHAFFSANALIRENLTYDVYEDVEKFHKIKEIFTKEFIQRYKGSGYHDKTPIFILGMPRSGTTLTEQILSTHSKVHGAGELIYLSKLILQHLCQGKDVITFPKCLKPFTNGDLERVGSYYTGQLREHSLDAEFITDKMPGNFFYVGLIKMILPNAKVLYCKRDPADICLSIYKNYFTDHHGYATDLNDLGIYCRHFRSLMEHWEEVLSGYMHTVVYEDMVADQEGETKKLLEFCGLPWEEKCLSFHEKKRTVDTLSMTQVRKPIYTSSSELWRKYEKHLAPLLEELRQPVDKEHSYAE